MNASRMTITIAGLALALSLAGCVMQPAFEDPNVTSQIHPGQSTKADVENLLGNPAGVTGVPGQGDMWMYRDIQPVGFGLVPNPGHIHDLTVMFDPQGMVKTVSADNQTLGNEPIWNKWLDPKNAGPKIEVTPATPSEGFF